MRKFCNRAICEFIWLKRRIKLRLRYRTWNLENVEPADYEDLTNF